ncbi:MAG: flagellar hook-basal body protein [Synergistales bacterium]
MFRGIYECVAAMRVQEAAVDVSANNLANAETSGFSKSLALAKAAPQAELVRIDRNPGGGARRTAVGSAALSVVLSETAVDVSPGAVRETGNPLDCAIVGDGYFQVTDSRETAYTREGRFSIDGQGRIVTPTGLALMGAEGPLAVGGANEIRIDSDGTVRADGTIVGRIAVFRFNAPGYLAREGNSRLKSTVSSGEPVPVPPEETRLSAGSVEGSNVSVVEEMARMISANRAYEAASKAFDAGSEAGRGMIEAFGL